LTGHGRDGIQVYENRVYRDLSERQTISYPVLRWKLRNRAFVHRPIVCGITRDYG